MAGRDIGSVVLPGADLKLYLDASLEKRAERRLSQQHEAGGQNAEDVTTTRAALAGRDERDSSRAVAPLQLPADARYLNTDDMDIPSVITHVRQFIDEWRAAQRPAGLHASR
jgi:cytidylate kinase